MGEFHSAKSASGAPKWSRCPGSITLEQRLADEGFVDGGSDYADEGTAAHELGALCLIEGKQAWDYLGETIVVNEKPFEVNREMCVAVQEYVDAILEIGADHRLVEERVSFDAWVPGNSGTLDCASFKEVAGRGHVWVDDYKHGAGVPVYAKGNEQLVLYAAGLIETFDFAFPMDEFHLRIHQPRAGGMSEWTLTREELLAHAARLRELAALSDSAEAPLVAGVKQCQFCKASSRCPARVAQLLQVITGACEGPQLTVADTTLLSNEQLAKLIPHFDNVKKTIKKIEDFALAELVAGREFPGFKVIEGDSRRKWKDENAVRADFELMKFDKKDYIEESLIGISKAEKLLPKLDRANFMSTHAEKPKGAPKLVSEDHPAPAMTSVADMFDNGFDDNEI